MIIYPFMMEEWLLQEVPPPGQWTLYISEGLQMKVLSVSIYCRQTIVTGGLEPPSPGRWTCYIFALDFTLYISVDLQRKRLMHVQCPFVAEKSLFQKAPPVPWTPFLSTHWHTEIIVTARTVDTTCIRPWTPHYISPWICGWKYNPCLFMAKKSLEDNLCNQMPSILHKAESLLLSLSLLIKQRRAGLCQRRA